MLGKCGLNRCCKKRIMSVGCESRGHLCNMHLTVALLVYAFVLPSRIRPRFTYWVRDQAAQAHKAVSTEVCQRHGQSVAAKTVGRR